MKYKPPFTITPAILRLVSEISELVGHVQALSGSTSPLLRRENRIRTIHASLAIENNTLTLEQVTAVLNGKHVLGQPREIQEVRNAFIAYEHLETWNPSSQNDILAAHAMLMAGLVDHPGQFRAGGVGVFQGSRVVHMAPPAHLVHRHMTNLLTWLATSDDHPLATSCIFHYEFEFIHPFEDGNGRIDRLLVNFVLHRYGYPMIVIHSEDKSNYLNILHQCDVEAGLTPSDGANATLNDILPFVNYLSSCLIRSLTLAIKAAKGESIEEEGDFEKKIAMLQRRYSDKAIEKSSRSVEQARSAFFELAVYVEQKISGLQKLFDRTFITNTPTWNMARKINTPNPDEPIIQSHILYTKSKEYGFVEDIIRLSKKSLVDYFKLKYDAVTFHFNHCRYAGDNTFDFPFCIYIQYLSDGCEVSCDIIPNSVKLPYNPDVLAEEGKEYMDTACNELLKLLEEKMNDKSPEN